MFEVTKTIEWDMGHRIPNHQSVCRSPHGHRYRLELTVGGERIARAGDSEEGMVVDFGVIKQATKTRIHDVLDHGFMVSTEDTIMTDFFAAHTDAGFRIIQVPFVPTVENICFWCFQQLEPVFQPPLAIRRVRVYETPSSWADYLPDQSADSKR